MSLRLAVTFCAMSLLLACSDSGKQSIMSTDGGLPDGGSQDLVSPTDLPPFDRVDQSHPTDLFEDLAQSDGNEPELVEVDLVTPDLGLEDQAEPDLVEVDLAEPDVEEVDLVEVDLYPPGPTCGDVFKCGLSKGCEEAGSDCWDSCMGEATGEALVEFGDLADCVAENCGMLPEEEKSDCLMESCLAEAMACLGGGGDDDCLTTFLCIQGCPADDGFCLFTCLEGTTEESLQLILDMSNATEMEGFSLMVECAGGHGDASCGEAIMCVTSCDDEPDPNDPESDPQMACMMNCISQTSPEAVEDVIAFVECASEQCPEGMEDCPGVMLCLGECPGLGF